MRGLNAAASAMSARLPATAGKQAPDIGVRSGPITGRNVKNVLTFR
jgi:hypothetical protein